MQQGSLHAQRSSVVTVANDTHIPVKNGSTRSGTTTTAAVRGRTPLEMISTITSRPIASSVCLSALPLLTPLEPQSRFGDKLLEI